MNCFHEYFVKSITLNNILRHHQPLQDRQLTNSTILILPLFSTCARVDFTLVQNMLVMVPGEMWGFKGRIFGAGTM